MATTESKRDNATAEANEGYDVQVVITQQSPDQPLPGEIFVNAPNNFSVITNYQKEEKLNDEETSKRHGKVHEAALKDKLTITLATSKRRGKIYEAAPKDEETSNGLIDEETSKRHGKIYEAALKGDWDKADEIFKSYRGDALAALTKNGDTALHVAAEAGKKDFVHELMSKYMEEIDLEKKNKEENTAFSIAAMSGNTELAEMMLNKNKNLTMIRRLGVLPVEMAAMLGNKKMVKYLYAATKCHFIESIANSSTKEDLIESLVRLIDNDLYAVAQSMVKDFPWLAVSRAKNKETALHALVKRPLTNSHRGILKRFYHGGTNMVQNKKMNPKALNLVKILWNEVVSQLDYYNTSKLIEEPFRVYLHAAAEGNIEFLSSLISEHPEFLFKVNKKRYTIFHIAVLQRQENIFKLIYKNSSIKNVVVALKDGKEENNILHLAANLPRDQNRLNVVPGAALQMQRELMWFKEVEKLMPPFYAGEKNKEGKTAHALFTESHKTLMKEGEEWMKTTSNSCMLVATLIATVVFAATFTVPGGVKNDTGAPNFLKKASFMIFIVSDIVSLVSSSFSILAFLSILTARYAEKDFRWWLPFKLLLGLSTLFISITAMMIVFCTALLILFNEGTKWPVVLAVGLASVPIIMFLLQQIPLLYDVIRLMCLSKSFSKK